MGCLCEELAGKIVITSPICIGHFWIFENLKPDELNALTENAFRKAYNAGDKVLSQDDPATQMFFVKAGRVKLSKLMEDGTEITLDIHKAGDFLAEYVLNEDMDYPVSVWGTEKPSPANLPKNSLKNSSSNIPILIC